PAVPALVSAPVRIADAGAAALLRPGDRVDVLAAARGRPDAEPRLLARAARVSRVPPPDSARSGGSAVSGGFDASDVAGDAEGALVVLSVPRHTAVALAGAGVSERLAVVVC
ncbi:hypothetical protein ACFQLX_24720, partial [Streptomyces polyrhachis]